MYSANIFADNDQAQKNMLKQSYSNHYLFDHQKFSTFSKNDDSTHSLPLFLREQISFRQFIADEKYNLQFFHSFEKTRKIINKQRKKKKLIRNLYFLPNNMPFNSTAFDDAKLPTTCMIQSSNFARNTPSDISSTKKTKLMTSIIAHKAIGVIDINKKRYMRHVERHITTMTNQQTKATLAFILQLNTYINSKILSLEKDSSKINEFHRQSEKFNVSPEKIIAPDTNTPLTLDLISKLNLNDTHLTEANDSIDISTQLPDNLDRSSKMILNENIALFSFYNQSILNNIFTKATDSTGSNELSSDNETNLFNICPPSLKEEGKVENQQTAAPTINERQKTSTKNENTIIDGCYYGPTKKENRTNYNAVNLVKVQKETPAEYRKFKTHTPCKFSDERIMNKPMSKIPHAPMKSIERKNSTSNRTERNIQQQATMFNSSLTNYNYPASESSIDLRNVLNASTEKTSLPPLHSRCLVSLEFANREEHLVEVAELPRSFHRASRIDMYKKIHNRLVSMSLIDMDLTAVLRTVLRSFS